MLAHARGALWLFRQVVSAIGAQATGATPEPLRGAFGAVAAELRAQDGEAGQLMRGEVGLGMTELVLGVEAGELGGLLAAHQGGPFFHRLLIRRTGLRKIDIVLPSEKTKPARTDVRHTLG